MVVVSICIQRSRVFDPAAYQCITPVIMPATLVATTFYINMVSGSSCAYTSTKNLVLFNSTGPVQNGHSLKQGANCLYEYLSQAKPLTGVDKLASSKSTAEVL